MLKFFYLQAAAQDLRQTPQVSSKRKCMTRLKCPARILFTLLIVGLGAGCQSFRLGELFSKPTAIGVYHTVRGGQTLYRIAEVYGVDLQVLQRTNSIRNADKIKEGQRLWIPNARRVLQMPETARPAKGLTQKKSQRVTWKRIKGYLIWPVRGVLTSTFGRRNGRNHDGIDIAAKKGTPIFAAAGGKVVLSGWGPTGYGLMVIIKHPNLLMTVYAHNSKNHVKENARVRQGQRIASIGSTGRSTGPHLHFEVRNDTHSVDPLKYLPKR
ncbi:MAG: M23 family metallopeptidase [Nitrospinota bacterium]|nr:M23 family metallopeptidase [Nitrospinota bacterium]